MKLSILKKMALPLITVAAFANNASAETNYIKIDDCVGVYGFCISTGPSRNLDVENFSINANANLLSFVDLNTALRDGVTRVYTIQAFGRTNETSFWALHTSDAGSYSYKYNYGIYGSEESSSTLLKTVRFYATSSGPQGFGLEDFLDEVKVMDYGAIRLVLSELQYEDMNYGTLKDYEKVAQQKAAYHRDHPTYVAYADVDFPYMRYLKIKRSTIEIPKESSSDISIDVKANGGFSYALEKKSPESESWQTVKIGSISSSAASEVKTLSYTIDWSDKPGVTNYRWAFTYGDDEVVYSDTYTVANVLPMKNVFFYGLNGELLKDVSLFVGVDASEFAPNVGVDNDYFHYFGKWNPELGPVTDDVEYRLVSLDSSLKILDLKAIMAEGSSIVLKTPSPCIKMEPYYLESITQGSSSWVDNTTKFNFVEGNQYAVHFEVSLDDSPKCVDDAYVKVIKNSTTEVKVYINGSQFRSSAVLKSSNGFRTDDVVYKDVASAAVTYVVKFIDFDESTVLQQSEVVAGEVPKAPSVFVKEDTDEFHYFVRWSPEIEPVTEDATYKASLDSLPLKIVLSAKYSIGGDIQISSENECVSLTKKFLVENNEDPDDDVYLYQFGFWSNSGESAVNLKADMPYQLVYSLAINEDDACATWKELDGTASAAFVYVNGEKKERFNTKLSYSYFFTPTSYDFGAITIAANRSSATIDGTSDVAVADMDGIEVSGDVTLNRSYVAGKYSTVMLPFATSASNVPGVSFYGLHDVVKKDGEWQVQVSPVSEIQANTPYIVVSSGDASNLVVTGGVTFNTTTGTRSSTAGNWQFVGTYEFRNWDEDHNAEEIGTTYGFASAEGDNDGVSIGTFGKVKAGAYIYPLRAYLRYVPVVTPKPASALAKSRAVASIDNLPESMDVVIVGGDSDEETTVIGTINTRTGEFRNAGDRWFDLKGRFLGVKRPTAKGTYYNNGKKVIVR